MPAGRPQNTSSRSWILAAAFLALLVKLWVAAVTVGTNDADTFYNFGRFIWEHGLLAQYRAAPEFNHTPLTGWFCAAAYGVAHGNGFDWLLRVPGILADFCSVLVLLRWREFNGGPPSWALTLYALSPVSLMVSGYHGNVDSVMTFLLLLAARECCENRADRLRAVARAGLQCESNSAARGARLLFLLDVQRACARVFSSCRNVHPRRMGCASRRDSQAISEPGARVWEQLGELGNLCIFCVRLAPTASIPSDSRASHLRRVFVISLLKAAIVAVALWTAWRRRRLPGAAVFSTLAFTWAAFFVIAPGVGAQYLVWIAPFLLIDSTCWYAAVTLTSGIFLAVFYQTISHEWPWHRGISTAELVSHWAGWSLLPWFTLAAFLVVRNEPEIAGPQPDAQSPISPALNGSLR